MLDACGIARQVVNINTAKTKREIICFARVNDERNFQQEAWPEIENSVSPQMAVCFCYVSAIPVNNGSSLSNSANLINLLVTHLLVL